MTRVSIDYHQTITPDEALELLAHHLRLSLSFFEASPDTPETRDEFSRLLLSGGGSETGPGYTAAMAFYDTADAWYKTDKANNP